MTYGQLDPYSNQCVPSLVSIKVRDENDNILLFLNVICCAALMEVLKKMVSQANKELAAQRPQLSMLINCANISILYL